MSNRNPSRYDANQVLQRAFIEQTGELRVNASIAPVGGATEVIISHENDSIRLGDGISLVTTSTASGHTGLDVNVLNNGIAGVPVVTVVSMAVSNTQYSFSIPLNTKKIQIKSRQSGLIKFSFTNGDIGSGSYVSISPGSYRDIDGIVVTTGLTLYFTSTKNSDTLEIMYWT